MEKYIISPHTLFDADENLWFTKMGVAGKNMPLYYTIWGKTSDECRQRANQLGEILTKHYNAEKITPVPGIDYPLLKKQKAELVRMQFFPEKYNLNKKQVNAITGITNLLDAIQDNQNAKP